MTAISDIAAGAAVGLGIAAPIGPMAMVCIHRTLLGGFRAGLATGAGASTVHAGYAGVAVVGWQGAQSLLAQERPLMSVAAACVLLFVATRALRSPPAAGTPASGGGVLGAYVSAVALNCSNPMTLLLLMGAAGALIHPAPTKTAAVILVMLGVFVGSIGWWTLLTGAVSMVRLQANPHLLKRLNVVAATLLIGFALLSLMRALPT